MNQFINNLSSFLCNHPPSDKPPPTIDGHNQLKLRNIAHSTPNETEAKSLIILMRREEGTSLTLLFVINRL